MRCGKGFNYRARLFLALFMSVLIINSWSLSWGEEKRDVIRVAGDNNYPPFEFIDKEHENTYRGFNVDVMRAIGIESGVDIKFVPMTWTDAKKALESGEVDAIQGMIKTESRQQIYDFSDPFYFSSQVIFVKIDNQYIISLQDLVGKRVAVQNGDVNDEMLDKTKSVQLKVYADQESALKSLIDGHSDAVLGNRTTGIYHLQKLKLDDQVKIVGDTVTSSDYACAVRKGDAKTLALLNEGIKQIKDKGTLKRINEKWFGENVNDYKAWKSLLIIAIIISLTLAALLSLFSLVNKRLQSEVKLRTEELERSSLFLEMQDAQKTQILNSITSGIVVFDKNGKVILFNEVCRVIIDKDIQKNLHWSEIAVCKLFGLELFEKALNEKTVISGNATVINNQNDTIYLHYTLRPVAYQALTENELILIVQDITQGKIYHEALHQNDKLSTLGRMSASIAHELRNPLSAIKQYVDLLPHKIENRKFVDQALLVLQKEVVRLNEIIDGLLDYSKFSENSKEMISVSDLVNDLYMLMKVDFLKRRVAFKTDYNWDQFYADPKQIKQVLINLIVNALDALPDEGGNIVIKSYLEDDEFVIEVADNGKGIPSEYLEKVFEPYFTTKSSGYGMGLAISKQMIEENGGKMSIKSRLNQGTVIRLSFPISA